MVAFRIVHIFDVKIENVMQVFHTIGAKFVTNKKIQWHTRKIHSSKTNWDEESLSHFMKKQISIKIQYIANGKYKYGMKKKLSPKDHDNSISEKIHTFPYL